MGGCGVWLTWRMTHNTTGNGGISNDEIIIGQVLSQWRFMEYIGPLVCEKIKTCRSIERTEYINYIR